MLKFLLKLFSLSFLLNFVWEITQMPLFGEMGLGIRSDYVEFLRIHWIVTAKDALMVVLVYLIIGVIMSDWSWAKSFSIENGRPNKFLEKIWFGVKNFNNGWIILWVTLPLWQGVVEHFSVYSYGRWEYADSMPLILGIGITPLLQMLILPSVAILLSRTSFNDNS